MASDSLAFESFDDPEHEFALRYTAKEAAGVIGALTAKSVIEVALQTAPVGLSLRIRAASDIWRPRT
jgi:linoleate 10R-lipoxygenase